MFEYCKISVHGQDDDENHDSIETHVSTKLNNPADKVTLKANQPKDFKWEKAKNNENVRSEHVLVNDTMFAVIFVTGVLHE